MFTGIKQIITGSYQTNVLRNHYPKQNIDLSKQPRAIRSGQGFPLSICIGMKQ